VFWAWCIPLLTAFPPQEKKAPLKLMSGGVTSRLVTCANVQLNAALMGSPGGNQFAIDELQSVTIVSAFKTDRLIVGAVDMNYLAWI
jgi:hypothetical protein